MGGELGNGLLKGDKRWKAYTVAVQAGYMYSERRRERSRDSGGDWLRCTMCGGGRVLARGGCEDQIRMDQGTQSFLASVYWRSARGIMHLIAEFGVE